MDKWLAARPGFTEIDWWSYFYGHVPDPQRHQMDTENFYTQLGLQIDPAQVPTANRTIIRSGRTDALDLSPAPPSRP
jgi:hypothetical protein